MDALSAVPVTLTASERKVLKMRVRGANTCWRDRLRAQVVLLAVRGRPNARIAAGLRAAMTRCGSGGGGSWSWDWRGWRTCPGRG
jgi:hypothetical protein